MRWIRPSTRHAIYARDSYTCVWCGVVYSRRSKKLSLDHVIDRKHGAINLPSNLLTCCLKCNRSRGTLTIGEWLKELDGEDVYIVAVTARYLHAVSTPIQRKK